MSETLMSQNGCEAINHLQERLGDPRVAESLSRLLDRLDFIAFVCEAAEDFVSRGDEIAESLAEGARELRDSAESQPGSTDWLRRTPSMLRTGARLTEAAAELDIDRLQQSHVLKRLTEPQTLDAIDRLLDRLPLLVFLLESLESFIERGDTIAENLADAAGEIRKGSSGRPTPFADYVQAMPKLKEAADRVLDSGLLDRGVGKIIDAGMSMIEHGMLDHDVVAVLGNVGKKAVETYEEVARQPVAPVGGLWSLMRATKDPDVQKTLGFAFAFLKAFAKHLK